MKLFLSVPFSSYVGSDGAVAAEYRATIEALLADLRAKNHDVYCALEYANWQMGGMQLPEDEFTHDLREIDAADAVVVLLEEQVSAGVQLENGYAFAKEKSIECYQIGKPAWSNIAFSRLNGHEIIPVQDVADFTAKVAAAH